MSSFYSFSISGNTNENFTKTLKFSLNSVNLVNQIIHCSLDWDQLKDPLCYLCLSGTVVASLSLRREIASSNTAILLNLIFSSPEFTEFSENI